MKVYYFLAIFLCIAIQSCSQVKRAGASVLHLLMSSSQDLQNISEDEKLNPITIDTTRPSILFSLENQKLNIIDTINFDFKLNSIMSECRHFEEFNFFYIKEKQVHGEWNDDKSGVYYTVSDVSNFVSVLDYSDGKLILRKAIADSILNDCSLLNGGSYLRNNELLYTFSMCDNQKLYDKNIINQNLEVKGIDENTFLHNVYERTESGFYSRDHAGIPFNAKGRLVLSFNEQLDFNRWPEIDFQFNETNFIPKKYSNINYLLKTPSSNHEVLFKQLYNGSTDSICAYYNYNKIDKSIRKIECSYYLLGMNLYNDNIGYGTILMRSKNKKENLPSMSRYTNKHGFIPDLSFNSGKFYIWNLQTNDFNVYEYKDLDLELLLIHEEWLYFRSFDELRRIKLINLETKINSSKTELLYKDRDIVPHIHHIFFSTKSELKTEYIKDKI